MVLNIVCLNQLRKNLLVKESVQYLDDNSDVRSQVNSRANGLIIRLIITWNVN